MITVELDADDGYRHWAPESQPIAPADIVLQFLSQGWRLHDQVFVEVYTRRNGRCIELFYFTLLLDHEQRSVPVVANPVVHRLIQEHGLRLFPLSGVEGCSDQLESAGRSYSEKQHEMVRLWL